MLQDSIQDLNNLVRNIRDDSSESNALTEIKEIESGINSSLRKFVSLLVDMEVCVKAGGSENQRAILNRFRNVYKELSSNYRLSKANADQKTTRIELFSGSYDQSQEDSETQLLLKEMTSTKNSLRMADSFLESATASYERLIDQRNRLGHSSELLKGISNRFPFVNSLVRSISSRKFRDK